MLREESDPRITEFKVQQALGAVESLLPLLRGILVEVQANKEAQYAMRKTIKEKMYEKKMD